MRIITNSLLFTLCFLLCACQTLPTQSRLNENKADTLTRLLQNLHELPEPPEGNDWRIAHPESPQSYLNFIQSQPTGCTDERQTIYLCLLGVFSPEEEALLKDVERYLGDFFDLPVKRLALPDTSLHIPANQQRLHPQTQKLQVRSTFLLNQVLLPQLPTDAVAFVGFTTWDLYPSDDWSFVFGQANLRKRTGVWSLARFGTGKVRETRTFKTATHEIGHIFSLKHCQDFQCVMAGSNNLNELDRHPLHFCPVCLAKTQYRLGFVVQSRYEALASFWQTKKEETLVDFYEKSAKQVRGLR